MQISGANWEMVDILSSDLQDLLKRALSRRTNGAARREAAECLRVEATGLEPKIASLLTDLHPEVVLKSSTVREATASTPASRYLADGPGLDRFNWVLSVAGHGRSSDVRTLTNFYVACAQWCACHFMSPVVQDLDGSIAVSTALSKVREELRRVFSTDTRFAWVTRKILLAAAREIGDDPDQFADVRWLTETSVMAFMDYIHRWKREFRVTSSEADAELSRLRAFLCVEAGSRKDEAVSDLLLSRDCEFAPLVSFNGFVAPVALRGAALAAEVAFFSQLVAHDKNMAGKLFERTSGRVLVDSLSNVRRLRSPLFSNVSSSDNGEIDFCVYNENVGIVGECKAFTTSRHARSVGSDVVDDIGGIRTQLTKRLEAISRGSIIRFGASRKEFDCDGRRMHGLGVILQTYGGSALNSDALEQSGALADDITVIPLHEAVIVAKCLQSIEALTAYIEYRSKALKNRINAGDETDLLVSFMSPRREEILKPVNAGALITPMTLREGDKAFSLNEPHGPEYPEELWSMLGPPAGWTLPDGARRG